MAHEILEHEAIPPELRTRLLRVLGSYQQMIDPERGQLPGAVVHWWTTALRGEQAEDADTPMTGELAAHTVLANLASDHERATAGWWSSALGRAIAWWIGVPVPDGHELIPTVLVEAALGVSKQRAHELRRAGRAVTQTQICEEMRGRWPR